MYKQFRGIPDRLFYQIPGPVMAEPQIVSALFQFLVVQSHGNILLDL